MAQNVAKRPALGSITIQKALARVIQVLLWPLTELWLSRADPLGICPI